MNKKINLSVLFLLCAMLSFAQNPGGLESGLDDAVTSLKSYMNPVVNMVMAIGGIVAVIGAIRIYQKWNSGDQDINKELMGWGGSALFLILAPIVVKAAFGF